MMAQNKSSPRKEKKKKKGCNQSESLELRWGTAGQTHGKNSSLMLRALTKR
jgi:hypothetical protein